MADSRSHAAGLRSNVQPALLSSFDFRCDLGPGRMSSVAGDLLEGIVHNTERSRSTIFGMRAFDGA